MVREDQEYPQCIKVQSSQKTATVGSVSYKSGEPWWHHNLSSKWHKRVQCLLEEEWPYQGDVSGSTSSEGSPELASWDEEGKDADPKGHPPGFQEIAECLTARGTPEGEAPVSMDIPETSVAPHTTDGACDSNGDLYLHGEGLKNRHCLCVDCDCLNGDHEFGGPLMAVGCQVATVENWQKKTWQMATPDCVNHSFPAYWKNCVYNQC